MMCIRLGSRNVGKVCGYVVTVRVRFRTRARARVRVKDRVGVAVRVRVTVIVRASGRSMTQVTGKLKGRFVNPKRNPNPICNPNPNPNPNSNWVVPPKKIEVTVQHA